MRTGATVLVDEAHQLTPVDPGGDYGRATCEGDDDQGQCISLQGTQKRWRGFICLQTRDSKGWFKYQHLHLIIIHV